MRATCPTGSDKKPDFRHRARYLRGFSLIELLIVLVIIGLSMAVIAPRLDQSLATIQLRASSRAVTAAARHAQNLAQKEQRDVLLLIDTAGRNFRTDRGTALRIRPADAKISVVGAESEKQSEHEIGIRFFADGSSTGGAVELALRAQRVAIEVDWLTGITRIAP